MRLDVLGPPWKPCCKVDLPTPVDRLGEAVDSRASQMTNDCFVSFFSFFQREA